MLPLSPRLLLTQAVRRLWACAASAVGGDAFDGAGASLAGAAAVGRSGASECGSVVAEEDALLRFDGERSLHEIAAVSGIGEHALYGLSYCLLALGALSHPHLLSPEEQKRRLLLQKARHGRGRSTMQ